MKWDGEYKNAHSKFVCKCEKHGEWVAKVYSFVAKSNRCRHCCYESRKKRLTLPQEKREQQIKNALDSTSSSFVKWFNLYENQYSKVVLKCEKHGDWERRVADLLKSNICPECTKEKQAIKNYYFTQDECELYIAKLCEGTHYSFAGWKNSYKGISSSRFSCSCALHGKYEVSLYSFIRGHRCQKCMGEKSASIKQTPKNEIEKRIKDRCVNTRWSFLNWDGEYKNQNSKFICKCEEHGDWVVSIANFISKGSRCPSCSVTGYNLTIKGSLYCLRSQCGQFIKIGISNKPKQRFTQLKRKTPFDFHIVELFTHEDGRKAQEWEKLFHQSFESANLTGFDGCTEWLKWNPQIPLWFRFLT